jgi:hypothetical protein
MVLVVVTLGVWMMNQREPGVAEVQPEDAVAQARPDEAASADGRAVAPEAADEGAPALAAPPTVAPARRSLDAADAPGAARAGRDDAPAAPPAEPAAPGAEAGRAVSDALAAREAAQAAPREAEGPPPASAWEAGEDVRLLSLRLQQIVETNEGLAWDEPPVPFGAAGAVTDAPTEGIRMVRDEAGPARVEVRMRTTPQERSSGQQNNR